MSTIAELIKKHSKFPGDIRITDDTSGYRFQQYSWQGKQAPRRPLLQRLLKWYRKTFRGTVYAEDSVPLNNECQGRFPL